MSESTLDAQSAVRSTTEIATMLHDTRPLAERIVDLCRYTADRLGCDRVSVMIWDGEFFRARYNWGNPADIAANFPSYRARRTAPLMSRLFDDGEDFIVINEARTDPAMAAVAATARIDSIVLASMYDHTGAPLGFMTAEYNERIGTFTEIDAEVVLGSARMAQGAIVTDREWNHRLRLASEFHSFIDGERRRVARDIHDDALQRTFALGAKLDGMRRAVDDPGLADQLDQLFDDCLRIGAAMREIATDSHPETATEAGTGRFLERLANQYEAESNVSCEVRCRLTRRPPTALESPLFRITEQALSNVVRHAQATKATIEVSEAEDGIRLSVTDDGVGFDGEPVHGHLGLISMKEHAIHAGGTLRVNSTIGEGTTIEAWLPDRMVPIDGDRYEDGSGGGASNQTSSSMRR